MVNIWNFQGKLLRKIEAHQGGAVWTVDYDEETDTLITGGADCSVNLFKQKEKFVTLPVALEEGMIPKQLSVMSRGNVVVLSEEGLLFYYIFSSKEWQFIGDLRTLQDYALLNVSDCKRQLAFTGRYCIIILLTLSMVCYPMLLIEL